MFIRSLQLSLQQFKNKLRVYALICEVAKPILYVECKKIVEKKVIRNNS